MTGAIIAAAGISSRMGECKPLLKFGKITIIERIISTLRGAGIDEIVIITGSKAEELERHLKNQGITFLRNKEYLTTQMLDSAKIGFRYYQGKCQKVIFTPADIPLYTQDTVKRLVLSDKAISYPLVNGKRGHPICIHQEVFESILTYTGQNGLKGALKEAETRKGIEAEEIDVADQGILYDVDMKADYEKLLQIHNQQIYRVQSEVRVRKEAVVIDDVIAQILYLIDIMGSIMDASVKMNISYSKALRLIYQVERELKREIVVRRQGGAQGGGACLTQDGKELLERFRKFQAECREAVDQLFQKNFADFLEK